MADGLANLRRTRGTYKSRLTNLETFIETFRASNDPIEILETRIEFIQNAWSTFDEIQTKIEEKDENDNERDEIEERYCLLVGRARALANSRQPRAQQNIRQNNQPHNGDNGIVAPELKVKLPIMNLPVFDGNPEQWLQFRDSFQGLIDTNGDLSDIQRMFYLRSSLKGRAAEVIQALESSVANYQIAWDLLKKRFEDKGAIANRHLQLLLDILTMQKESGTLLRQTLDRMLRHLRALRQLEDDNWETIMIYILMSKLDNMTKRDWRSHVKGLEAVQVSNLTDFLEDRCLILEPKNVKPETSSRSEKKAPAQQRKSGQSNSFTTTSDEKQVFRKCAYCHEESHSIYACNKFKELSVPQRQDIVKERKLCRNCLRPHHNATNCTSTHCKRCEVKHNTLLHPDGHSENPSSKNREQADQARGSGISNSESSVVLTSTTNWSTLSAPSRIILSTARVWLHDRDSTRVECRVLLDSGSQFNFITRELTKRLKLRTQKQACSVKGLGQAIDLTESTGAVMQSQHTAYRTKERFLITERIIDKLPLSSVEISHLKIPPNINLADNTFHIPGKVDVILGAGIFWDLLCIGRIKLGKNQPILQKTHRGWIAAGDITPDVQQTAAVCYLSADTILHEQVERFWKIEEIDAEPPRSKNDESCENDFLHTYQRDASGRFIVSLPFREDPSELGESRSNALKRLYKIERKLDREPEIKAEYVKFMKEYEELGHMTAVTGTKEDVSTTYVIPHHAVVTTKNDQIKLRVVFDASAKTTSGKSLNDILRVGPTIQQTLFNIVLRFRQHRFVVTADIVKMYRQVNIREEQRDLQQILWRSSSDEPVRLYRLNTVTYGLASAPYLAIRALHQTAYEARESHLAASQVICRDFYVDDLLTGSDDLRELQSLKDEISEVLESAGFKLAKWNSNEPSLFTHTSEAPRVLSIGDEVKTLGLSWTSANDTLQYRVNFRNTEGRVTKRRVLSIASQIFDPLGLVGPSTIRATILLQRMWQLNLAWDESLPSQLHTEWVEYIEQLWSINDISIPRAILCPKPIRIELHGFSDASESAYGACIYLRSIDNEGTSTVRLLCAKSRVAPLKTICVPRLELCGALLLAKLGHQVFEVFSIPIHDSFYWSDSTIVLAWLNSEPYLRKTFIANRVTEIQQLTSRDRWHHVRSEDNPADIISRGVNPTQLEHLDLWWHGPEWLCDPKEHLAMEIPQLTGEIPETKQKIVAFTQVLDTNDILEKFSSFSRLKRVLAYCLRWKTPHTAAKPREVGSLTVDELDRSSKSIIKCVQACCFSQEISDLKMKQCVRHDSVLLSLRPFLDEDQIIRVGGRLSNAHVEYTRQHPIVLPANHHVTRLIIREGHYKNLHLGAQALHSVLQDSFWILSARSTIRKVLHT